MNIRHYVSAAVAALSMTGCSSLNVHNVTVNAIHLSSVQSHESTSVSDSNNRLQPSSPTPAPTPAPAPAAIERAGRKEVRKHLCPQYQLPPLPLIPEIPLKQIERVGPGGGAQITAIERRHIEDLRVHVQRERELIVRSHSLYVGACRIYTVLE